MKIIELKAGEKLFMKNQEILRIN